MSIETSGTASTPFAEGPSEAEQLLRRWTQGDLNHYEFDLALQSLAEIPLATSEETL